MAFLDQTDPLKLKPNAPRGTTEERSVAPALPFRVVTIRPFLRADVDGLQDYFGSLSVRARGDRFMGARWRLSDQEIELLLAAQGRTHFGIVAEAPRDGGSLIIGEAQYAIDRASNAAEIALSVADPWQRRGLGLILMKSMQHCAANRGVVQLHGETLRSNDSMIALAQRTGFALESTPADWRDLRFVKQLRAPKWACPDRYEFALKPPHSNARSVADALRA